MGRSEGLAFVICVLSGATVESVCHDIEIVAKNPSQYLCVTYEKEGETCCSELCPEDNKNCIIPLDSTQCPTTAPQVGDACGLDPSISACSYEPFCCPDGDYCALTLSAECAGGTWEVSTADIFCPSTPTTDPTLTPTGEDIIPSADECIDSLTWHVKDKPSKTCDAYIGGHGPGGVCPKASPRYRRCRKLGADGTRASEACPVACGSCDTCTDSPTWNIKGKPAKDCEYVDRKPEKRCKKQSASDETGFDACPLACDTCTNDAGWSLSWHVPGKPSKDCRYVAKKPEKRCSKTDENEVPAYSACPCACV